jgi:hypothetical protein
MCQVTSSGRRSFELSTSFAQFNNVFLQEINFRQRGLRWRVGAVLCSDSGISSVITEERSCAKRRFFHALLRYVIGKRPDDLTSLLSP